MEEQITPWGLAATEYLESISQSNQTDNDLYKSLEKEAAMRKFVEEDPGLKDGLLQMLIMAQGPKAFSYLVPELTTTARVANAIKEKTPMRLTGLPRAKDVANFTKDAASRDKVLWTLTGNGVKAGATLDRVEE